MNVFVTGASAGFGKAIVKKFIENEHNVIGVARRIERLTMLKKEFGAHFHPIQLDICDRFAVQAAIQSLPAEFSDVEVLVNNAGLALGLEPAQEANFNDWQMMIDTNITGLVSVTHTILPGMVKRKNGHIINLGSIAGTYPYPGGNVYGATKAFVKQFSLNLRSDLAGTRVRVTDIEPGLCGGTEFSTVRFKGDQAKAASVYKNTQPLLPNDIAEIVFWIAMQPKHININRIELMPVSQSFSALAVTRDHH